MTDLEGHVRPRNKIHNIGGCYCPYIANSDCFRTNAESEHSFTLLILHTSFLSSSLAECSDGDIRLMGGASSLEGRVEMCGNDSYSTVCDDFWDELEAQIVCRQLGYIGSSESRQSRLLGNWYILQ